MILLVDVVMEIRQVALTTEDGEVGYTLNMPGLGLLGLTMPYNTRYEGLVVFS